MLRNIQEGLNALGLKEFGIRVDEVQDIDVEAELVE